jgi:hypothetical protein
MAAHRTEGVPARQTFGFTFTVLGCDLPTLERLAAGEVRRLLGAWYTDGDLIEGAELHWGMAVASPSPSLAVVDEPRLPAGRLDWKATVRGSLSFLGVLRAE